MHRKIFLCLATGIISGSLLGWTASAGTDSGSILPQSFRGWTETSKAVFAPSGAANAGGATGNYTQAMAVVQEYGLASGEHATYVHGEEKLDVAVYRMKDASGAYGEYSYLRSPDMPRSDLAEHSSMSQERALALDGNLVLDIRGRDLARLNADLKELVAQVGRHAEKGILPTLMNNLPTKDLQERTDHYVLGPATLDQIFPVSIGKALGFADGAEAEVAQYKLAGHDATLLIVDYPTPQAASKKLRELQQQFNINGSQSSSGSPALYAKRSLTLLAFVAGAKSQAEANGLLGQIQSGTELTWNEPTFQFTEPSIGTMIVGTIIGTGIICMFALISGLAFGGFRLVVKRALPNKVFDRSDQLQILQLGLSSKPIEAEDFYGLGPGSQN
jgi:hypothetical protein